MASHANPVNWFELPVADMARARAFYEAVLEIEIPETEMGPNKMGWFPMNREEYGAAGVLIQGEAYVPSHQGAMVFINVDAIDPTLEAITANGGKVLLPKTDIGPHGSIAHFEDSEGNRVALHQSPSA